MTRHKVGRKPKDSSGNPEYRLHKRTGQAVVTLPLGNGKRKDVYLGKHGSEESKAEYVRVIAVWAANGRQAPIGPVADPSTDLTIDELVSRFIDHANMVYRDTSFPSVHGRNLCSSRSLMPEQAIRPAMYCAHAMPSANYGPLNGPREKPECNHLKSTGASRMQSAYRVSGIR